MVSGTTGTDVDRYEWERLVRRARIGSTTKYVGMTMAQYANRDGSSIRPGVARLVAVTELSERTVRGALTRLRQLGFVERVREGSSLGRRAITDEYRLTIPVDLLDRVAMLDPDETAAPDAAVLDTSPAAPAADTASEASEHRQLLQGSPAAPARTPATGAENTGRSCTPPNQDQPQDLTTDQRASSVRNVTTGDDVLAQLIEIDRIAARRRPA